MTGIERRERPGHRRAHRTAATSPATPSSPARPAGRRRSPTWPASAPDLDEHPPGLRHRAGQAVPRRRDRLVADARLHLADRPRRVPDGLRRSSRTRRSRSKGTFPFIESLADAHARALPAAGTARRSSVSGPASRDMTPDYSPILGVTEVDGFIIDCGWGTYGFKASPIVGTTLAELVATKKTPGAHRAVQARALLHRHARIRARGGRRRAMTLTPGLRPFDPRRREWQRPRSPRTSRSPRRTSSSRSRRSPSATASSRTSTTSTAATRPRSTSRSSTGSPASPTRRSSASPRSRRRRRARARRRRPSR